MSIVPVPGPRPTTAPLTTPIYDTPQGGETTRGFTYRYRVGSGRTLYSENLDQVFPNARLDNSTALWDIVNDGTIWSSRMLGNNRYGSAQLVNGVNNFTNNGLVVMETVGDIEYGVVISLFGPNETRLTNFTNNGEIYVLNDTLWGHSDDFLNTSHASGVTAYNSDATLTNNGLFAVWAEGGNAGGFSLRNGGELTNTANGRIVVEGETAYGISTQGGNTHNYGLIQVVSTRPEFAPSIGVINGGNSTFTNHFSGVVTADIAVFGSLWVNNFGQLNGDVVADREGFFILQNGATGVITGNLVGGDDIDTITNAGLIQGNLLALNGNDQIDSSAGAIAGIVDLGLGNDTYRGGAGRDRVTGDNGDDTIFGNGGNDLLLGGGNDDTLDGGSGNDGLFGETGNDTIITRGGDHIDGGSGNDIVRLQDYGFAFATGGSGFDILYMPLGLRTFDLSAILATGRLHSFEQINLAGNQRIVIRNTDIVAMDTEARSLFVNTTSTDTIELVGNWIDQGYVTIDSVQYPHYSLSGHSLYFGGSGTLAIVDAPTPGAIGLDTIIGGEAAPLPGAASGLSLTPVELFVQALELRELTRIDREETWFTLGAAPAIVSQVDGMQLNIDGRLIALNETGAQATGISMVNRSRIDNEGEISVLSIGPQQSPHPDTFPSARDGAIAIERAFDVQNMGMIHAASEFGMASALGWTRYAAAEPGLAISGEGIADIFFVGDLATNATNFANIYVEAANGHAFGVTTSFLFNTESGVIDVEGGRVAVGAVTNGDLSNMGTIMARTSTGGVGRSFGIVVAQGRGNVLSDPSTGEQTIVNGGVVTADYAVVAVNFFSYSNSVILENSGTLNGRVVMGNSVDYVANTGLIAGAVELASQDDVFDGSEGIQLGPIYGDGGNDTIIGGRGAEILVGGAGNDTLDGNGNVDTAIVGGRRSAYTITQTSTGTFRVTGTDGTDTLTNIEYLQFDDVTVRLRPGTGTAVDFENAYQSAMNAIRDFDGNDVGGRGNWLRIGAADVNGDGDVDQILVNDALGRFATVGIAEDGLVYFSDHSWAGETRVAGIYIDPLVTSGEVIEGSANDSQRRFQNDLEIENINRVLGADDYDGDGLQEVYFALNDGTAYLHAYMHEDGNIRYANYQSQEQVIEFLTANGFGADTYANWFGNAQEGGAQEDALADDLIVKERPEPISLLPDMDLSALPMFEDRSIENFA